MVPMGIMVLFFCTFLTGCSLSLCGLTVGGKEELAFRCEDGVPEVPKEKDDTAAVSGEETEAADGKASLPEGQPDAEQPETSDDGKVNLNTAGMEELMTLKGVGESRAKAIIEYRTRQGGFSRIEDIMQIPGIKEGIFSKIQDKITVH